MFLWIMCQCRDQHTQMLSFLVHICRKKYSLPLKSSLCTVEYSTATYLLQFTYLAWFFIARLVTQNIISHLLSWPIDQQAKRNGHQHHSKSTQSSYSVNCFSFPKNHILYYSFNHRGIIALIRRLWALKY